MPNDFEEPGLDGIFARSDIAANAIQAAAIDRVVRFVARNRNRMTDSELLGGVREILEPAQLTVARILTDAQITASNLAIVSIQNELPDLVTVGIDAITPPPPPGSNVLGSSFQPDPLIRFPRIERAAELTAERNAVTRPIFDAAGTQARSESFTVAFLNTNDAVETVQRTTVEAIQQGFTRQTFQNRLAENLETSRLGPAHTETVFRTNIQRAFFQSFDEFADAPVVNEVFPYQRYVPIKDSRTRETHEELAELGIDGTNIYRRDDPFWDVFTPPWAFNCRCGVALITIEAAARAGVEEARQWLRTGVKPPLQSRLPFIPFRPDPDFVPVRVRAA